MTDKRMISEEAFRAWWFQDGGKATDLQNELHSNALEWMRDYDSKPQYSQWVRDVFERLIQYCLTWESNDKIDKMDEDVVRIQIKHLAKALEGVVPVPEKATDQHCISYWGGAAVSDNSWASLSPGTQATISQGIQVLFDHLRKEGK